MCERQQPNRRSQGATNREDAIRRASLAWGTCAVYVRGTLRAAGVKGQLRQLDEWAVGKRGRGLVGRLIDLVAWQRRHGVARQHTENCLRQLATDITDGVYRTNYGRPTRRDDNGAA